MTAVDIPPDRTAAAASPSQLELTLGERVAGEVRFDRASRAAYSTDASNYRQVPIGVVVPRDVEDVVETLAACRDQHVPVLSRGGGTSLAGQCTNTAVMLDWTKHCRRLISVDVAARRCVVEPGIALDDLNRALAPHGLMFGPRPATHRSCTIGGMIGNNSCGSTAQAYGKTVDNLVRMEVLTYDGLRMWVGPTSDQEYADIVAAGGRRAEIYAGLRRLRDDHLALIRTRYPKIPRRVSGYNLDSLLPENHFDLARALVGSESTLVTVLRAELSLVPVPRHKSMVVLGYPDIAAAGDAVTGVLPHHPWQLEGLDQVLIELEKEEGLAHQATKELPHGGGWLMVQFAADTVDEADAKAHRLIDDLRGGDHEPQVHFFDDPEKEEQLIDLREAGLGATAHPSGRKENWEGWEDAAVHPHRLGDYLRDFVDLLEEFGYNVDQTSLYGHFGQGCVHTRIPFGLRTADGVATYRRFVERAADLVASYGGSLSGEHGDGQSRGELLTRMFGDQVVALFGQVKSLFDPDNRMNPGKVVDPNPLDGQLRLGVDYTHAEPRGFFAYPADQGRFSVAALRCVGVGNCRNSVSDEQVMCPSYMVTREEEHSTRGRSRLLFEMLRGEVITDGWRSTEVAGALDLCLACKGCKSDCPVGVDMATYKAEFLAHHYRGRPRPRAHYAMGWLPLLVRAAAPAAGLVNLLTGIAPVSRLAKRLGGIAGERDLPVFAAKPFTKSAPPDLGPSSGSGERVILWPDTFTNFFHPAIARAAVTVLRDAGFTVDLPPEPVCCGLTWVSTGQLGIARRVLSRTVRILRDDIRAGVPVVGLEPSCTAMLRSDGPDLLAGDEDVGRLGKQTRTLAELLDQRAPDWQPPTLTVNALVQTHCHQHAVLGTDADAKLLRKAGVHADDVRGGCCGLAGNFGFEAGHYEVSRAVGERVLLPRVRQADSRTVVLADGFSCRTQIEQGDTDRTAVHLAELLAAGIQGRDLDRYPEDAIADRPRRPGRAHSRSKET